MSGAAARRQAMRELIAAGLSEAAACRTLAISRSSYRYVSRRPDDLVVGREAGGEQFELLQGRRHTAGRPYATALADCHLAEVAADVDADR